LRRRAASCSCTPQSAWPFNCVGAALAFGVALIAATLPPRSGRLGRLRGALMLVLYAGYVWALAMLGMAR